MKKIIFHNLKGGVSKTSTVTSVAVVLANRYNKKVLLVDLDPQANTSQMFSNISMDDILKKLFLSKIYMDRGRGDLAPVYEDLHDDVGVILGDANADPHAVIHHTRIKNIDIIPSSIFLTKYEDILRDCSDSDRLTRLRDNLKKLDAEYDYCLIDCAPAKSIINFNGFVAADVLFCPIKADAYSLGGLGLTSMMYHEVKKNFNPLLKFGGILFMQWEQTKNAAKDCVKFLEGVAPQDLLKISDSSSSVYTRWFARNKEYNRQIKSLEDREPSPGTEAWEMWNREKTAVERGNKNAWNPPCGDYIAIRRSKDFEEGSLNKITVYELDPNVRSHICADIVLLTDYILHHY